MYAHADRVLKATKPFVQKLAVQRLSAFGLGGTGEMILREAGFNAHRIELTLAREEIVRRRQIERAGSDCSAAELPTRENCKRQ